MRIHTAEINLNQTLTELEQTFATVAEEKNLRLIADIQTGHGSYQLEAEASQLKKIFNILINNAIRFTPFGVVNFGYFCSEKTIQFYVKDTGIGIASELIESLFSSRTDNGNQGLSAAKSLTEQLGGKIWVESEFGQGSIFYFRLPFFEKKNIGPLKSPKSDFQESTKTVILVAEDDIHSLMFLKTLLNIEGFEVLEANNGRKAVEAVENHPEIGLVLIDMKMPEIDGIEATKRIKQIRPELPVVAQTAYALAEEIDKAMQAGCDDYVTKPLKKQMLMESILKLI